MKIVEALKDEDILNIRLSYEDRWLIYDANISRFIVLQRKYRARRTVCLMQTSDEDEAVKVLLRD